MKPPICAVCFRRFSPGENAGLLTFTLSEEDRADNERFRKTTMVGHLRGQEWFCEEHYGKAATQRHRTLREVLRDWED
jgi:hypothetical protein